MHELVDKFLYIFPEHREDISFIQNAHNGQNRHDGSPYFLHPIKVCILGENVAQKENIEYNAELRKAMLFHDVVEDNTQITFADIENIAGKNVAEWIKPVTKVKPKNWKQLKEHEKLAWTMVHYRSLRSAPIQSSIIKVADRIDNLSDHNASSFQFRQKYVLDTAVLIAAIRHVVPNANQELETIYWRSTKGFVDAMPDTHNNEE